ncbi:PAS domain-containing protein [Halorussus gelatinilyticus]|uniref:PAS domain-containing protein n=1 Tax=Halorussus gelatinilyticus TaxID=2937524 RepID=A0A8U0IFP9_9EURY|nr:bacterio-opsin activator domain-containing protein [Halorussus gelatinilyticus]UPV99113.1 PAS domain-containing protein [Halorussus gelatinilyticus]
MSEPDTRTPLPEYTRQLEAIVESSTDAILVKDVEGRYRFANEAAAEFLGRDADDLIGKTDRELFGEETAAELRDHERTVLDGEETATFEESLPMDDGERVFETTCSPYYDREGDLAGTVSICRDVTERTVRERTLEDQRDELATLDRINEVSQGIIRALIGEPGREEIAQAVCDRLVETELYQTAWVGEPDPANEKMADVVGAGLNDEIRSLVEIIDASEGSGEPAAIAYHEGEPQVIDDVENDETLPPEMQRGLLDLGYYSGIIVPIRYGDTTYGLLGVGTERRSAFSQREVDAFDVLGDVIGFAIGAVKHRRLALSDTVVELTFRLTDSDSFYVAASEQLGCTLRLEGMAAGPDGSLLFYDAVSGVDSEAVFEFAEDWDAIENVRLVSDHGDEALFEFTVTGSSVVLTLSEFGAKTKDATSEGGEATVVAELPSDADVRSVVERVRAKYPGAELVAKRETERDFQSAREFRRDFDQRLTDAQRTALRASYFAGYYEWPRDSTAEDVAEALGVSSPTFHQHIRKAQRELLGAFFDRNGDRP